MIDDRHQADDDLYVPTPKEVATKRGKRRLRRVTGKSTKAQGTKHQRRRKGGFNLKISKRAAEKRTEAPPPRPSVTTEHIPDPSATTEPTAPISPEAQPAITEPTPTEEKPKPRAEPERSSSDTPSTETDKGKKEGKGRIQFSRPDTAEKSAPTPTELLLPEGRERATYMAKQLGHELKPWQTAPIYISGKEEYHYTTCIRCGNKARATLEPQVASPSEWRYTEALDDPCGG